MGNWIQRIGQPFVTLVTAILAIFISVNTFFMEGRIKKETHELKSQIDLLTEARTDLQSERDFYFKTLDKVLDSIEKKDESYQAALVALLNAEKQNDRREGLLQVLASQSQSDKIKSVITVARKENAEYQAAQENPSYTSISTKALSTVSSGWNLDVFWCEGNNADKNKSNAKTLAGYLANFAKTRDKLEGEPIGRIRTRPLAESINSRPGYRIAGSQIRYDGYEREKLFANNLKTNIRDKKLGDFITIQSRSNTKQYVSLFICE